MPKKCIINCAVTGAIHVPSQTPHLPITPEQIAKEGGVERPRFRFEEAQEEVDVRGVERIAGVLRDEIGQIDVTQFTFDQCFVLFLNFSFFK